MLDDNEAVTRPPVVDASEVGLPATEPPTPEPPAPAVPAVSADLVVWEKFAENLIRDSKSDLETLFRENPQFKAFKIELSKFITKDEMLKKLGGVCSIKTIQEYDNILQSFENCKAISKELQSATKKAAGAMSTHLFVKARKDVRDKKYEAKQFLEHKPRKLRSIRGNQLRRQPHGSSVQGHRVQEVLISCRSSRHCQKFLASGKLSKC